MFARLCFWEKLKDSLSLTFVLVPANFLPFGKGEIVTPRLDNGSSEAVTLQQPFKFFGRTHNQTIVSIFSCSCPYLDAHLLSTCIGNKYLKMTKTSSFTLFSCFSLYLQVFANVKFRGLLIRNINQKELWLILPLPSVTSFFPSPHMQMFCPNFLGQQQWRSNIYWVTVRLHPPAEFWKRHNSSSLDSPWQQAWWNYLL